MRTVLSIDHEKTGAYFTRLSSLFGGRRHVALVAVVHLVSNTESFLDALDDAFDVKLIVGKRNSVDPTTAAWVQARFPNTMLAANALDEGGPKSWAKDAGRVVAEILARTESDQPVALLDLGGYFAESLNDIAHLLGDRFLGVVEGTENGVQKYQAAGTLARPVFSVAGSPLKYPENHLVGVSVVHSVESVLRDHGQVLQSKRACVIGFGRVGRAAADTLRSRGVATTVHDISAIAMAEAAALGFQVQANLRDALQRTNLVICATGRRSLQSRSFGWITNRSFVATVTSADDELALSDLETGWIQKEYELRSGPGAVSEYYDGVSKRFYLIDRGNAVNFLHGAVIGPAIRLIEGEKLAALAGLVDRTGVPGIANSVPLDARQTIAQLWIEHFLVDGTV